MTYLELKQAIDRLTPEQLAQPVRWWGDERGGTIDSLSVLEGPWANYGEGFEEVASYEGDPPDEDEIGRLEAGTPILRTDETPVKVKELPLGSRGLWGG